MTKEQRCLIQGCRNMLDGICTADKREPRAGDPAGLYVAMSESEKQAIWDCLGVLVELLNMESGGQPVRLMRENRT